jgi:hypothetical protein
LKLLNGAMAEAWSNAHKEGSKLIAKSDPIVRANIQRILENKVEIEKALREKVAGQLGTALTKYISPYIQPLFTILDQPMKEGVKQIRAVFEKRSNDIVGKDGKMTAKEKAALDAIARTPSEVTLITTCAQNISDPLNKLISKEPEVFQDIKPDRIIASAESTLLELLDACFYTLQQKMDPPAPPAPTSGQAPEPAPQPMSYDAAMKEILATLDRDSIIQRGTWLKNVISSSLITCFKRNTDPQVTPIITEMQSHIPEDFKEIMDIRAEYDAFVDAFIAEPINKNVEAAYSVK